MIIVGDALATLRTLPDASVQCCVTSPPYWGLRDYGHAGQLGLERTPGEYVEAMRAVFAEVRRVLRDDGTCWVNLGDSYNSNSDMTRNDEKAAKGLRDLPRKQRGTIRGLKPKDLVGIPWRVAFALQADGWYLRSDIIWAKPNPMPESVTDRPRKAHEYVFLLSKSERYFYDADAIAEAAIYAGEQLGIVRGTKRRALAMGAAPSENEKPGADADIASHRNRRTVWTITTQSFPEAHFATFPEELPRLCILAGSRVGDTVLDPFCGSGTTGAVADAHQRKFLGIELNPEYAAMARRRIERDGAPLFSEVGQ